MITDRHYLIPVVAAATLHVIAFLSIHRSAVPHFVKAAPLAMPPDRWMKLTMPDDPPETPEILADASPKPESAPQPPQLEEAPPQHADAPFTISAEPPRLSTLAALTVPAVSLDGPLTHGTSGVAIISSRLLDNAPRTRSQRPPQFPFGARLEGIEGHVLIEFTVDEAGRVVAPRVLSANDARFEAPTLAAISAWRFEPGRRDGKVVRFRIQVPVDFTLSQN